MNYLAIALVLYLIPTILYAAFLWRQGALTGCAFLFGVAAAILFGLTWPYALYTLVRARLILNSKDDHEH